jgi:hypothetical protein
MTSLARPFKHVQHPGAKSHYTSHHVATVSRPCREHVATCVAIVSRRCRDGVATCRARVAHMYMLRTCRAVSRPIDESIESVKSPTIRSPIVPDSPTIRQSDNVQQAFPTIFRATMLVHVRERVRQSDKPDNPQSVRQSHEPHASDIVRQSRQLHRTHLEIDAKQVRTSIREQTMQSESAAHVPNMCREQNVMQNGRQDSGAKGGSRKMLKSR